MKILMVDGDPSGHTVIGDILTQRGCHLLEVKSCEQALNVAHKEKPAIAIVDLLTPKFDRGDFVCQLRCDPAVARMPVIFYTEGYLEIASGLARDADTLLTAMLMCEEAIRGNVNAKDKASGSSSDQPGQGASSEGAGVQELFGFGSGPKRTLLRLGDLIADIVEDARKTFPRSIEIRTAYSEDLWLIEGDRMQLERVLNKLFLSARDAMPKGGSLLVWAQNFNVDQRYASMTLGASLGRYVMLRISDTGRGIPRPVTGDVFNSFLERKEVGPGTSLGLIRSHGGFMSVYSQLERGTTFQIFLPARVAATVPALAAGQSCDLTASQLFVSA